MNAGVPIETTEENGMERARRKEILRSTQNVIEFVRVLTRDVSKREFGELASQGGCDHADLKGSGSPATDRYVFRQADRIVFLALTPVESGRTQVTLS